MAELSLDSSFPNNQSWTLYFHDTENKKWTLDTFLKVTTVETWRSLFHLIDTIDYDLWQRGMFFWMLDPIPPLWENFANIRGGNYSMRINQKDILDVFTKYMIASVTGEATSQKDNIIHGVAMTPKKGFYVIKIWNKDSTKFNNADDLVVLDKCIKPGEVIYTPFVEKRM